MRSEEARVGAKVRVRESSAKARLRGMVGTVAKTYGPPEHRALHVRFEDGLWQLLWPAELEEETREDERYV